MELTWQTICHLGSSTRSISRRVNSGWLYTQAGSACRFEAEASRSIVAAGTLFMGISPTRLYGHLMYAEDCQVGKSERCSKANRRQNYRFGATETGFGGRATRGGRAVPDARFIWLYNI